MNLFSAIILGHYIKVKSFLTSLKTMFEKSLLHKIYNRSYTHLGGLLVWHFHLKHSFIVNNWAEGFSKMN